MRLNTIGVMSPGDMGHGIGRALRESGRRVLTNLSGRSERSRSLATEAGLEDAGSLEAIMATADLVLSILPPAAAIGFATDAATAMAKARRAPAFADLNAISPATSAKIGEIIAAAGGSYIDGSIIGLTPGKAAPPRVYVSGPDAAPLESLTMPTMIWRLAGPEPGQASTLKMLYAGLNKGTWALQCTMAIAAERYGLTDAFMGEVAGSNPNRAKDMESWVGFLAADAERWHPEMAEIAETLTAIGAPEGFHRGAEELFRFLATTPLAAETRQSWDRTRPMADSVRIFADALAKQTG
jgi:3-hydroxyisobutyrate dehydrogenase-like beta-hydroxyacid dehydrogenase